MAHAQPEPIDGSLLRLQDNHISNQVLEDQERMIHQRYNFVWAFIHLDWIDSRVKNIITLAGFYHVINDGKVNINQHLVSVLIERWRTETHISFSTWRGNHYFIGCGPIVGFED